MTRWLIHFRVDSIISLGEHSIHIIPYISKELDLVDQAIANFAAYNTDPKAQIITTYNSILGMLH